MEYKKGLYILNSVGLCEGFSFYGAGMILTLFMTQFLNLSLGFSLLIYGTYCGLVYISSLLGGYLSDTIIGCRYLISIGNILMLVGLSILTLSALIYNPNIPLHSQFIYTIPEIMLIISLICIILGEGIMRVSISSIVPQLYDNPNSEIDKTYTSINMAINIGMVSASVLLGLTVGEGNPILYKYGFLFLTLSSLTGLIIYNIFKNKYLINKEGELIGLKPMEKNIGRKVKKKIHLTIKEKNHVKAIIIIEIICLIFFIGFEQIDSVLMFFTKDYVTNTIALVPFTITPELIRFIEPFGVILFSLILIKYSKNKNMTGSLVSKIIIGVFLLLLCYSLFYIPCILADLGIINISIGFIVIMELIRSISEILILPIILTIVSILAPKKYLSRLMSLTYLSLAAAYIISGWLTRFFPLSSTTTPYFLGIVPIANFKSYCLIFIVMYLILLIGVLLSKENIKKLME